MQTEIFYHIVKSLVARIVNVGHRSVELGQVPSASVGVQAHRRSVQPWFIGFGCGRKVQPFSVSSGGFSVLLWQARCRFSFSSFLLVLVDAEVVRVVEVSLIEAGSLSEEVGL